MPAPRHARIGFYTARPGDLDHVLERARDEVIPMLELEPGFRRYTIVRTGPDALVSLTGWETHEEAQLAARRLSAWVAEVMGPTLVSVENQIAEVIHHTETSTAAPAYARLARFQFTEGGAADARRKVEAELVPLIQQQPGFVRYVVFQTGPDSVISYTAFASKEQADAAAAVTRPWVDRNVAADIAAVERYAGEVVWAVRKD
jgi:heme-degrading monooxygenase HmoA